MLRTTFFFFTIFFIDIAYGQSSRDAAMMLEAKIDRATPSITLHWTKNENIVRYLIFRKSPDVVSWGVPLKTLTSTDSFFVDTNVEVGKLYEYRVDKTGSNFTGNGYITCGIEVPEIVDRGKIIVVVDRMMNDSLSAELNTLHNDLIGDGYQLKWVVIERNDAVTEVKAKISHIYKSDPVNTKSLMLIGHVPVAYSGAINPDGHGDHYGAWPTDIYYADIDGDWTDTNIETNASNPARIVNKIGDGKFDQSIINSTVELQTGRIDFYDMPAFSKSEVALMRDYLNKAHAYKNKLFSLADRAVIDDNFGYFSGEAFAASGYNNFAALVGRGKITEGDYFSTLSQEGGGYKWSYGCGGGWYSGAGGVGSTTDFAKSDLNSAFTLLFGSYFGDWDVQNSFLRAPLAQGKTLTCSWSGRPHHQYHHMALGQSIGYSFAKGINNNNYFPNIYGINGRWIHNNLMGDPTLRNDVLSPPSNLSLSAEKGIIKAQWEGSKDNNVDYYIYLKKIESNQFIKVGTVDSITNTFEYACASSVGTYMVMVKAAKLTLSPSGSYFNLSQGVFDTIDIKELNTLMAVIESTTDQNTINLHNASINYTSIEWYVNGVKVSEEEDLKYKVDSVGHYTFILKAYNECGVDSAKFDFILSGSYEIDDNITLAPNPASESVYINGLLSIANVTLTDVQGRQWPISYNENKILFGNIPNGYYSIKIKDNLGHSIIKPLHIHKP